MFKQALSSISQRLSGVASSSAATITPIVGKSVERILQQGIENISMRSPMLADVASTMLENVKLEHARSAKLQSYIKSSKSDELRSQVSSNIKSDDSKKIDKEMYRVLDKITKAIDKTGIEEAKKSDLFKQYSKIFSEFERKQPQPEPKQEPTDSAKLLSKIDVNTQRTADSIDKISGAPTENKPSEVYTDERGAPSVRAAVSGIGSKFLSKIFDDQTIEKFAAKSKETFVDLFTNKPEEVTPETVVPKARPQPTKRSDAFDKVESLLSKISLDLNTPIEQVSSAETKKESSLVADKKAKESIDVSKQSLEELKKLNSIDKPPKEKSSLLSSTFNKVKDKLTGTLKKGSGSAETVSSTLGIPSVAKAATGAIPGVLSTLGVVAAGASGLALGSKAITPLIDQGISKATGKENSLGSWIYDKLNPEAEFKSTPKVTPNAQRLGTTVAKLSDKKEKLASEAATKQQQPIVISSNSTQQTAPSQAGPQLLVPTSVRNNDSTFERVQMQDFWPRVA